METRFMATLMVVAYPIVFILLNILTIIEEQKITTFKKYNTTIKYLWKYNYHSKF
jgi:hypothetical protein